MMRDTKKLMDAHGMNFMTALVFGSRRIIRLVNDTPVLTKREKIREINRIVRLVFRFDSGSFSEEDACEALFLLGAVPVSHPCYIRTPILHKR